MSIRATKSATELLHEVHFALGDATRFGLVSILSDGGRPSLSQLTDRFDISRQAVSKHLNVLELAGVVRRSKVGRESLFELVPGRLALVAAALARVAADANLRQLLRQLRPSLQPGRYAFVSVTDPAVLGDALVVASIHEVEGLSAVVREEDAVALDLEVRLTAEWITLEVASGLVAVGLAAAVTAALTGAGIACNMVAGSLHDHLFVPSERADDALEVLRALGREDGVV